MTAQHLGLVAALRQIYGFMSPARRRHLFWVLALMLLGAFAELAAVASVMPFLALLSGSDRTYELGLFREIVAGLGFQSSNARVVASATLFMTVVLLAAGVRLMLTWTTQRFAVRLGHEIAVEIQRRILHQPYDFHTRHNSSEVLALLEKVQILVFGVLLQLMYAVTAVVIIVVIVAALIRIDPFTASIATLAFSALYLLISSFAARQLMRNSTISGKAYSERLKLLQESLGGIRDVIVDHSQAAYVEAFRLVDRRFAEANASSSFIGVAPRFAVEAAGMVVIAALALILSDREGGLIGAFPILGAMALGALRLLPFLQQFYFGWTSLAGNRLVTTQVLDLLRLPLADAQTGSAPYASALGWQTRLRCDQVSFTYVAARRPALRDVSISIPRGARVALVGKSGSGKSTLADLLMGLLQPSEGSIMIDDVVLTPETRRAWQRGIAHVSQSIFLADTNIARNIAFGVPGQPTDAVRLAEAIRIAQLDEVIATLPQGIETVIGEGGVRLSGGQRQRIGIARAVYKDAALLVLDEATNALDEATEAAVMGALDQYAANRTLIIITHRPARVASCDLVIRLDGGRVVDIISNPKLAPGTNVRSGS